MSNRLARPVLYLGLVQAILWGAQHPLQSPMLQGFGGSIQGIAFVSFFSSLSILAFMSCRLILFLKMEHMRIIFASRNGLLCIFLYSGLSISSGYLYGFSQYELQSPILVSVIASLSPFAAFIFASNVGRKRVEWLGSVCSRKSLLALVFHLLVGAAVAYLLLLPSAELDGEITYPGVLCAVLVPAFYYLSYVVVARMFYWMPEGVPCGFIRGNVSFYKVAATFALMLSSLFGILISASIIYLSNEEFSVLWAQLKPADLALYISGAIIASCIGSVWYFYTYEFDEGTREAATFWYHLPPVFVVLFYLLIEFLTTGIVSFSGLYTPILVVFLTVSAVSLYKVLELRGKGKESNG